MLNERGQSIPTGINYDVIDGADGPVLVPWTSDTERSKPLTKTGDGYELAGVGPYVGTIRPRSGQPALIYKHKAEAWIPSEWNYSKAAWRMA